MERLEKFRDAVDRRSDYHEDWGLTDWRRSCYEWGKCENKIGRSAKSNWKEHPECARKSAETWNPNCIELHLMTRMTRHQKINLQIYLTT